MLTPKNRNRIIPEKVSAVLDKVLLSTRRRRGRRSYKYDNDRNFFKDLQVMNSDIFIEIVGFVQDCIENVPVMPLVCGGFVLFLTIVYVTVAIFVYSVSSSSSSAIITPSQNESAGVSVPITPKTIESAQNIAIDELLQKLIKMRIVGNMLDFEEVLHPIMDKHCLQTIPSSFLSTEARENFHMNLGNIVAFVANQHKLGEFANGLRLTVEGGIIDAKNSHVAEYLKSSSITCPLLERLYHSFVSSSSKLLSENVNNIVKTASDLKYEDNDDTDIDRFAKKFEWKTPAMYVDIMLQLMEIECPQLTEAFDQELKKTFILNFFEICDQIGTRVGVGVGVGDGDGDGNQNNESAKKPSKPNPKHKNKNKKSKKIIVDANDDRIFDVYYVVGRDAHIYSIDRAMYLDEAFNNEYLKCDTVIEILNTPIELDDSFHMANIDIVVNNHPAFQTNRRGRARKHNRA